MRGSSRENSMSSPFFSRLGFSATLREIGLTVEHVKLDCELSMI